jgi:DnaJ-class molecular chaperone
MDIQRACEILEMDVIQIVDLDNVRRQYRKLALQHHPDKNDGTPESNEKFKEINEAYHHLKNLNDRKQTIHTQMPTTYADLLGLFIQSVFMKTTTNKTESFIQIIKDILVKNVSFEGLDKSILIEVYEFMSKYKHVLHVSPDILMQLKTIVTNKCKNDQIYILNPTLKDLFDGNVYKLLVGEKTYYVPLWHAETYFDGGDNGDIVVRCIPELPENVSIDENNNVYINATMPLTSDLLDQEYIQVSIYEKKTINVKVAELKIIKKQNIIFRREGIYHINENSPYDTRSMADIIVCLQLTNK